MKAIEAPEKIYLSAVDLEEIGYLLEESNDSKDVEYTRTDAFIEKARKWFEMQPEHYDANGVRCYGTEDFEDFKNYMKGE